MGGNEDKKWDENEKKLFSKVLKTQYFSKISSLHKIKSFSTWRKAIE